jgi:hypothetical protein
MSIANDLDVNREFDLNPNVDRDLIPGVGSWVLSAMAVLPC